MINLNTWNKTHSFKNPLKYQNKIAYLKTMITVIISIVIFIITLAWTYDFNFKQDNIALAYIIMQIFLSGFILGFCAYLIQKLTKNRFSDTSIMGISSVNILGVIIIAFQVDFNNFSADKLSTLEHTEPIIFFIAPIILCMLYYFTCKEQSSFNYKKMLISGVIVNFLSVALGASIAKNLPKLANAYVSRYTYGSIEPQQESFFIALVLIIIGLLIVLFNFKKIQIVSSNQDLANQLGINVKLTSGLLLVAICLMVGASYSLNGNLIFIGLMAGNMGSVISNNRFKSAAISSGCCGSLIYMLSFLLFIKILNFDSQWLNLAIPLIISPYFIYIIVKKNKSDL